MKYILNNWKVCNLILWLEQQIKLFKVYENLQRNASCKLCKLVHLPWEISARKIVA